VLLLRADMDALPIAEQTSLDFASTNAGVMHACGHDAHTAILLGVAHVLSTLRAELSTDVLFMFQPAEEAGLGARRMLDDGLFEVARPEVAYMLHVWHDLEAGVLAVPTGPVMAGALMFEIIVSGRGGHAARPQLALDPVVTSAHIVAMLQTVVSREMDPSQPVVLTIGSIQAGEAANVIPDTARILGTARAYDREILRVVQRRIEEVATTTAAALRLSATVQFAAAIPPVINDGAAASHAVEAIRGELGSEAVGEVGPSMGSEDFAFVLDEVPGSMIRLGVRSPLWHEARPIHTATFDLDEHALRSGVIALSAIALRHGSRAIPPR
jgi:amidohydrolase